MKDTGATVVAAIPDNSFMVSVPSGAGLPGGVHWSGTLRSEQKLSTALSADGWNAAMVEFHHDVNSADQDLVAAEEGFVLLRKAQWREDHAMAFGTFAELAALAAHDEVAYIFPADLELISNTAIRYCAGMMTQSGRVAQYSNIVHGWDLGSDQKVHLNYVWGNLAPKVPELQAQSEILRALNEWAKYSNIALEPSTDPTAAHTLSIGFFNGKHGDPYPFDGPGGVLAHTFYPVPVNPEPIAGDMHFDAAENWQVGADIDIYAVALHEAGHALGLGHSDNPSDVMYPYYRNTAQLSANDIGALQQLYGAPMVVVATQPIIATPPPAAAPISLTINPVPSTSTASSISISGSLSGEVLPASLSWQTDHGTSGGTTAGDSGSWSFTGIPLVAGLNSITVNAIDGTHHSASAAVAVHYTPPANPNPPVTPTPTSTTFGPLSVSIQSPIGGTVSTADSTISLSGVASGGNGNLTVSWQSSVGLVGIATGTNSWSAQNIPLYLGTNTLVVRAVDTTGASAWTAVVVTRR